MAGKFDTEFIDHLPENCKFICHNGAGMFHFMADHSNNFSNSDLKDTIQSIRGHALREES